MGRRAVPVSAGERWVFNRLAYDYASRPPYPEALVARLAALAGGTGCRVVDLGAGIGHLALPLAARGCAVTAVEPAREMLAALQRRARSGRTVRGSTGGTDAQGGPVTVVHAAAESTGLAAAGFDLVLLADAVQWVDPELAGREAARLLAPGGVAAVVEAAFADTPFMAGLAALLAAANPKARPRRPGAARQVLALAAPGRAPACEAFVQEAVLDDAALAAVLRSFSFAGPALGPEALEALSGAATALARAAGGARFRRDLTLRWAARRRPLRA
jgi:SAM-dependent methyltransferase